jgi:hypothetical protein
VGVSWGLWGCFRGPSDGAAWQTEWEKFSFSFRGRIKMTGILSGPMFEPSVGDIWKSVHSKEGAHYNTYGCDDDSGMEALRRMFPDGEANDLNFVLFSTSGIHGSYCTIEDVEQERMNDNLDYEPHLTFLIVHPRICCLRYGNCIPKTEDDFTYLKKLRASSREAVKEIG